MRQAGDLQSAKDGQVGQLHTQGPLHGPPGPPLPRSWVIHLLAPPSPQGQVQPAPELNRPKLARPHPQEE